MKHFTLTLTAAASAALMAVGCQEKPENGSVSLHSDAQMTLRPPLPTLPFPSPPPLTGQHQSRAGNG